MARLPLKPTAVWGILKELRAAAEDFRPLLITGSPEHAQALRAMLVEGGDPEAVRDLSGREVSPYDLEGARVLVHLVAGVEVGEEGEQTLRLAERKDVDVVCVLVGAPAGEVPDVPYVLATDVIAVAPGEALPFEAIAERIADRAGEASHQLAARLPALRPVVVESIVKAFSVQNGVLAVAIFIPGADFPVLTLNQIRMVLRIAAAHGEEIDRERIVEVLSVVGAGLGFRTIARQFAGVVPGLGWAVKGGVAYVGTRALGEAATAYFAAGGTRMLGGSVRPRS
ncbi:MAG: hypothetical protein ACRDNI_07785 [Gaiellaceae bacterium]